MTGLNTLFNVADNSGVQKILSLQNLTKNSSRVQIGDLLVGVVKSILPKNKLNFSNIVYGVVIRLKKNTSLKKTYNLRSNENALVLVDKNLNVLGSRIFGSVPKYLKEKKCLKLSSLTLDLI